MIERNDLFHLSFYKKTHFTGSFQGMRYYITKAKESDAEDAGDVLRAIVYPEPYNFENTPDEDKTHADFPFTEEGLDAACVWMNEQYETRRDYWQHTPAY
ncbi:MAG: GNAT family acetyltransferase [bacterium]|nr:GNAT family acetyltransferase [bacterium]MDY4098465.1 GNAT family acetyltransferase [Lachnospiraceae bacterium]